MTATIELPPPPDEVKIKASALVDDGREAIVFVQPDPGQHEYVLRRVSVMRRQRDWVYVRSKLPDNPEPSKPGDDDAKEPSPLKPGDHVISGAVLMKAALENQQGER